MATLEKRFTEQSQRDVELGGENQGLSSGQKEEVARAFMKVEVRLKEEVGQLTERLETIKHQLEEQRQRGEGPEREDQVLSPGQKEEVGRIVAEEIPVLMGEQVSHLKDQVESLAQQLNKQLQRESESEGEDHGPPGKKKKWIRVTAIRKVEDALTGKIVQLTTRVEAIEHRLAGVGKDESTTPLLKEPDNITEEPQPLQQTERSSALLPLGWQAALQEAHITSAQQTNSGKPDFTAAHYGQRLRNIRTTLQEWAQTSGSALQIELGHLKLLEEEGFQVHRLGEEGSEGGVICPVCQGGEQSLWFQVFPLLEEKEQDRLWVLLPLGNFDRNRFARGYQRLLEEVPGGFVEFTEIVNPGLLLKKIGEEYVVAQKMRVKHEKSPT